MTVEACRSTDRAAGATLDKIPLTAYIKWVKVQLGDRLTAGLQTLDLPIKVRILVPQPG